MQRQIRILKRAGRRSAFALIAAVFLMLLVSMMLLKMLSYSAENAQQVVNDYLLEQAQLAAYGATEYAMLQISTDDRSAAGSCTQKIKMDYPSAGQKIFDINVTIQYVWDAASVATLPATCKVNNLTVTTAEQDGSAYVNVIVASDPALGLDEPIRFTRKTLQKL